MPSEGLIPINVSSKLSNNSFSCSKHKALQVPYKVIRAMMASCQSTDIALHLVLGGME